MKKNLIGVGSLAVVVSAGAVLTSCVSETPFNIETGNGNLKIEAQVRGDVTISTKAEANYDRATLERNLVVYIEKQGSNAGLVRKYIGKNTIPSNISLEAGDYVVEGWTGDSVSASWDKKFYRAYQPVKIKAQGNESVTLKCNIANSIVSVKKESLDAGIDDLHVSFWHSRKGQENEYVLDFGKTEMEEDAKGYFMMPTVDHVSGSKETVINYKITGIAMDGSDFVKEGTLENVKSAHEYQVLIKADNSYSETSGGALIRLEIEDIDVVEEMVDVFPAPTYEAYYGNSAFDIKSQVDLTSGVFNIYEVTAVCYKGVKNFQFQFSDNFSGMEGYSNVNVINDPDIRTSLNALGVVYDRKTTQDKVSGSQDETIQVDEVIIKITDEFLRNLAPSDKEYSITVMATDGKYQSSSAVIRFANTEAAIDHPAPIGSVDMNKQENIDYTAITSRSATLYGEIYNDEASNYGIKYREKGATDWNEVVAESTRADVKRYSVRVDNLKPGTEYEYKAFCDGFEEQDVRSFTTEAIFEIPNAGLEDWSYLTSNNKVLIPAAGGTVSFWDTGNHGSATMSKLVTNQTDALKHGGSYSAELKSQFVGIGILGKFAAGNLFVGSYDKTDGTDGELTFGRPYNGSHPTALTLFANYRPGVGVSKKGADSSYINEGATDEGQIYVALTSAPVSIKTKSKQLFDADADYVVAYGQVTWTGDFGADGSLDKVTIPLEYKERAKKTKPTHLVIVCSASKYGDFFSGGEGSLLYVDDFELVYE